MLFYLLTYHGQFLCRGSEAGRLTQLPLELVNDREQLVAINVAPEMVRPDYRSFISNALGVTATVDVRHLGARPIRFDTRTRAISIEQNGRFVSALRDGKVVDNREKVAGWELFALVTDADLDMLKTMQAETWIVRSTRALVPPGGMRLGEGWMMIFDEVKAPLPFNLPSDMPQFPFRFTVLQNGWRIDEVFLYKPLIYYVSFGAEHILEQLYISLNSLIDIGHYTGDVVVFTDRTHAEVCAKAPSFPPERLHIRTIPAKDWVGYVAGKYCILEEEVAWHHQPVVYMDPDIVYNTDTTSFLIPMAVAGRPTAPIELFSRLDASPSVGSVLLQRDNANPELACGFNGGTIGVPNLPEHGRTLTLIRRVIENFLAENGRNALQWVNQEAANYVSYKRDHFDTNEISSCVRYGSRLENTQPMGPRSGLVHFWRVPRKDRTMVMQTDLDKLRALDAGEQGSPRVQTAVA